MKKIRTLGIDLAKNIFQLHGSDDKGQKLFSKKVKRDKLFDEVEKMDKTEDFMVAMEACGGAHHIARSLKSRGFDARLISPQFIKPFVQSRGRSKNDAIDASAIAEVARRPQTHCVGIKTVDHQDILVIHRVRENLIKRRTALSNEMRGFLLERGITIPKGILHLKRLIPSILEDSENGLTSNFRELLKDVYEDFLKCFKKVEKYDNELKELSQKDSNCRRLCQIEGIGEIISTALVSSIGDISVFSNGRQFSSWLGLVPREYSTGGRIKFLGISKRGDSYLRKQLIHGCRSVVQHTMNKEILDKKGQWIKNKLKDKGINCTSVALANKTARLIWAVLIRQEDYKRVS